MGEWKLVRLRNVEVVARGWRGSSGSCDDFENVADGYAILCMYEPEGFEIDNKCIESIEEVPDEIVGCTTKVYEEACMLIDIGSELLYVFSDGEYGHIERIPREWLELLGFAKVHDKSPED